jgi:glutathione peroxidase-family protein
VDVAELNEHPVFMLYNSFILACMAIWNFKHWILNKMGKILRYVGKSISKLQMDIELKQTRVLI